MIQANTQTIAAIAAITIAAVKIVQDEIHYWIDRRDKRNETGEQDQPDN